ncbi:MAG: hypothetical protein GWN71_36530, partial [Gammaproteobacteria bacterium]|nr:hypothetical protein [Gammaproteobacteria bacterium]NIY12007.1 hypothetical protein [Gemmatimonadota bacterium]
MSASIEDDGTLYGWALFPDGSTSSWRGERVETFAGGNGAGPARDVPELELPDIRPAMAYGRVSMPEQPDA